MNIFYEPQRDASGFNTKQLKMGQQNKQFIDGKLICSTLMRGAYFERLLVVLRFGVLGFAKKGLPQPASSYLSRGL